MMLRSIVLLLCLFGCAGMPPYPSPTQYISGPLVLDPISRHLRSPAPTNAEIRERLDALSRSLGDLKQTIDSENK